MNSSEVVQVNRVAEDNRPLMIQFRNFCLHLLDSLSIAAGVEANLVAIPLALFRRDDVDCQ